MKIKNIFKVKPLFFIVIFSAIGLITAAFLLAAGNAHLYLSPETSTYNNGQEFTVEVRANTNGENVNVVEAYLSYPADKLGFVRIDSTGSAFASSVEESGGSGSVNLSRFVPGGGSVTGNILISKVTFKALQGSGGAVVSFKNSSAIYSNGANVLGSKTGGTYNLSTPAPPPEPTPLPAPAPASSDNSTPQPAAQTSPSNSGSTTPSNQSSTTPGASSSQQPSTGSAEASATVADDTQTAESDSSSTDPSPDHTDHETTATTIDAINSSKRTLYIAVSGIVLVLATAAIIWTVLQRKNRTKLADVSMPLAQPADNEQNGDLPDSNSPTIPYQPDTLIYPTQDKPTAEKPSEPQSPKK